MKSLAAHTGELILLTVVVAALFCYTLALLKGQSDQTLGNVLMASIGALGAFMQKRFRTEPDDDKTELKKEN